MKAKELMIDDLVIVDEIGCLTPIKVLEVGINYAVVFDDDSETMEDYLQPIPLTAEILEKNGITLLEVGDDGIATPKSQRNRYEKWFIHTKFVDTYLWYDRHSMRWHLHNMSGAKFKHVHELQHALRLCGLNDLADNFKL